MGGLLTHRGSGGANKALSNLANVAIKTALVFAPGSDTDMDLFKVNVTGTPTLSWDESEDRFSFSKGFHIADGGAIVVGHAEQVDFGAVSAFQVLGTGTPDSSMGFARFQDNAAGPDVRFLKSRGDTIGENTIVQDNDKLGRFRFQGADGGDFNTTAAEISCEVDGTPALNKIPGRLIFKTRNTAGTFTERMRIDNAGNVLFGSAVEIDGDLNHDGSNVGFYGVTPAAQPSHIADANGTLSDITTKFNQLLADHASQGLQAAA